jgi:hypothetical protein
MRRTTIPFKDQKFILANYNKMSCNDISKRIGLSSGIVRRFLKRLDIHVPKEVGRMAATMKIRLRTTSTPRIDKFIIENYLTMSSKAMAREIKRSGTFVFTRMSRLGLVVPDNIIQARMEASRFALGTSPPNKGKKMPEEIKNRIKHTFFKKGNLPKNTKHDGYISVRKDSKGRYYAYIRISKGKFELLHRHLWIQENGAIPKGMNVAFKNGNSLDCRLENLEVITKGENMMRNSIINLPEDLREVILVLNQLKRKIKKYEKQ